MPGVRSSMPSESAARVVPLVSLLAILSFGACVERNPARPPPDHAALAPGGVWVAYNLGCELGCDDIKRGDRILAVDGRPVSSGTELDAIGLARGQPLALKVASYGSDEVREVTLLATPNDMLPPLEDMPPLLTVGAAALDRAPSWARSRLFGHTIPALRFHRADEPRGFVNGRELYGRAAVIMLWSPGLTNNKTGYEQAYAAAPHVYARLQQHADALAGVEVDVYFVVLRRADPAFREHLRSAADPGPNGHLPIFELASAPTDGNTLGIQGSAADIRENLLAPSVLVLDRRGIVRFHARGYPAGYEGTLEVAVDFAAHQLTDAPPVQVASR